MSQSSHKLRACIVAFTLVACFYFFQFIVQVSPGVIFEQISYQWHISAVAFGLMSSTFLYGYVILQMPVGFLLDRYPAYTVLSIATLLLAISTCLFAMSHNLTLGTISRALMGISSAFAFVGSLYVAMRRFLPKYFAMLAGITEMIGAIGAISGNIIFATLLSHFNWHNVYWILGGIAFILAGLIYWSVKTSRKYIPPKPEKQLRLGQTIKKVVRNKKLYAPALYGFSIWGPVVAFIGLWGVPFLCADNHITVTTAAFMIAFAWFGLAIGSPIFGHLSGHFKRRRIFLFIAALIGLSSFALLLIFHNPPLPILAILLFLIGFSAGIQAVTFGLVNDISQKKVANTTSGFINTVSVASGILLQPLIGLYLDHHWSGKTNHQGLRIYSWHDFQHATAPLLLCYLVALLVTCFFIKETYCKRARL